MKDAGETDLNENLCCSSCKSYLIDAVTLTECLHSYCRACLLRDIEKNESYNCTKCGVSCGNDLGEAFVRDDTLQKLVYKMVPDLYWQELHQRGEFLRKRIVSPDEKATILDKRLLQLASELCAPDEMISLCLEYISPGIPDTDIDENSSKEEENEGEEGKKEKNKEIENKEGINKEEVAVPKSTDENKPSTVADADRLEKQETILTSFKRYFRCQAATKISALRKLLEAKLEVLDTYKLCFVDSDCNVVLDDQCTLQDVVYMFSWQRLGPMKILFTLQRPLEEEKPPVLDMEFMPELVAEEPISQASAPTIAIETAIQLPALTVSLNTAMMEGGSNHQPIITTEVYPTSRKKRKCNVPTKKQATPPVPVQRMTGVSPLAKGPPPLVRTESIVSKKSTSSSRIAKATKALSNEDSPPLKKAKLMSSSFDNKLQQIIDSPTQSTETSSASQAKPTTAEKSSTSPVLKTESFDLSVNKSESKDVSLQPEKAADSDIIKKEVGSVKVEGESTPIKEKSLNKLHTISKITENTAAITTISSPVCTTTTSTTICHPRPIQPRPVEMKTNYEALVKSYALNGMTSKLSQMCMDGKLCGFSTPAQMHSPLFMDPKIAAQPIKQILSGRGMPTVPDAVAFLRNSTLANFMQQLQMQSSPPVTALAAVSTTSVVSQTNGSSSHSMSSLIQVTSVAATTSAPAAISTSVASKSSQQTRVSTAATNPLPTAVTNASSSPDNNNKASSPPPSPVQQQKNASPVPVPTAHSTPFISQS
ncbi:unnamed protein product [Thelazia callipaeda]|uniref:RING-type domain-containing protein n=1 Tax=Thelazia callipaeda TaxID=103827 RepID=A0A158RC21_THECL|nr:unnamed protein product [Thelazia callipaeda]